MTETTLNRLLALLHAMPSTQGWNKFTQEMYTAILSPWEEGFASDVVKAAYSQEEWRPSPARLGTIAAQVASPIPDEASCYAEILYKAQQVGLYGMPDPARPSVMLAGPPPMSHPVVGQVVAYLGGWQMVCTGETNLQEGLRKQARSAWESVSRQWVESVRRELTLPCTVRNRALFPCWTPFALPSGYVPPMEYMTWEREEVDAIPMPPEIRARLTALGLEEIGRNMPETDGGD